MGLPGILGDRFFKIMDVDGNMRISSSEFLSTLQRLYCDDLDSNFLLVFELYDFDKDGFISPEDVRTVLSHLQIVPRARPARSGSPR